MPLFRPSPFGTTWLRQADRVALVGAVGAARQHHVHHARDADGSFGTRTDAPPPT